MLHKESCDLSGHSISKWKKLLGKFTLMVNINTVNFRDAHLYKFYE